MRILISSCVRQSPEILTEFLHGLRKLNKPPEVDYYFILHNLTTEAKDIIYRFDFDSKNVRFKVMSDNIQYKRDDSSTHKWRPEIVDKVIEMKNDILDFAKKGAYTHVFFTDSDQVHHPDTVLDLMKWEEDIVGQISWSRWTPNSPPMPNAWYKHPYEFNGRMEELREPYLHPVAGFGGCYLISRHALQKGVSFSRVDGKDHWGEDRHFHIRAKKLGFKSYIDTNQEYFHIYRDTDIPRLHEWITNNYTEKKIEVKLGTVLIAVPIGETWIHPELTKWLVHTLRNHHDWGLEINRLHPIDSNRNTIVKKFMTVPENQKYEWLLFVDSDITPPIHGAERLLRSGEKIVGGLCFIMGNNGIPIPNISKDLEGGLHKAELTEVKGMGTGFMLIHRDVLQDIGKSPFRFRYDDEGVVTICGEDYDFCEKAVKLGYKIYADFAVQCSHYKQVDLTLINKTLSRIVTEGHERRPKKPSKNRVNGSKRNNR